MSFRQADKSLRRFYVFHDVGNFSRFTQGAGMIEQTNRHIGVRWVWMKMRHTENRKPLAWSTGNNAIKMPEIEVAPVDALHFQYVALDKLTIRWDVSARAINIHANASMSASSKNATPS